MREKIFNFGQMVIKVIFIAIMTFLLFNAILRNIREYPVRDFIVSFNSIGINLISVLFYITVIILLICLRRKFPLNKKKWNQIYLGVLLTSCFLFFFNLPYISDDQKNIQLGIDIINSGRFELLETIFNHYFKVWPHTLQNAMYQRLFFNPLIFFLANILLLATSYILLIKTFSYNEILSLGIILCIPIIRYTMFYYGEITGIFMISLSIYILNKIIIDKDRWYHYLILLIFTFIGYFAKTNVIIFIIAEICTLLLWAIKKYKHKYLMAIFILLIAVLTTKPVFNYVLDNVWHLNNMRQAPMTSWIAMGLQKPVKNFNDEYNVPGEYNTYNFYVMLKNDFDIKKANTESIQNIKESINYFANHPLYTLDYFSKKVGYQWGTPDWSSSTIRLTEFTRYKDLNAKTYNNDWIIENEQEYIGEVYEIEDLDITKEDIIKPSDYIEDSFSKGMMIIVYATSLIYIFINRKNELSFIDALCVISLIGYVMFSAIWEAKPRYNIYGYWTLIILAMPKIKSMIIKVRGKFFHKRLEVE